MMKEERQRRIMELLSTDRKISFAELSRHLDVSYDSIRRDVIELEDKGFLRKVHGGAISNSYFNFLSDHSAKSAQGDDLRIIQKKAQTLLKEKQTILFDGGNTNFFLAQQIPKKLSVTVITNSVPLAMSLAEHTNIETILLGGTYYPHYQITMGLQVVEQLQNLSPDLYFMGVNGVSAEEGFTIRHHEEAMLKRRMMQAARQTVCCVIEEKLEITEAYKVGSIREVDLMITNLRPDAPNLAHYVENGLKVL